MPEQQDAIRLGTRGSPLARWQADWVAGQLAESGIVVQRVLITTQGDARAGPIGSIGGQGVFTKEIQRALLDDAIDFAVHSLKDLPTEQVDGLQLVSVPPREGCRDVLVCDAATSLAELPSGARVGTGSLRRRAQLLHYRNDLEVLDIRGNVDTRLRKLDQGDYDAIILAEAGLKRLGFEHRAKYPISPTIMLPAVGQGALGLEARSDDRATCQVLSHLDDALAHDAVTAERTMLALLQGGCLAPIGAWARPEADQMRLDGVVLSSDGAERLTASARAPLGQGAGIGRDVAEQLLEQGAAELIER